MEIDHGREQIPEPDPDESNEETSIVVPEGSQVISRLLPDGKLPVKRNEGFLSEEYAQDWDRHARDHGD